jgi:hypothetical protein
MTNIINTQVTDVVPTYLGRGDPAGRFVDYHPARMDKLASDVTLEGSMLDGAVQGADAIRAVLVGVREPYDRQDFNFADPWGDNGFIEDYTAEVDGRPLGCLHLITFNADGQTQHIAAHYRPLRGKWDPGLHPSVGGDRRPSARNSRPLRRPSRSRVLGKPPGRELPFHRPERRARRIDGSSRAMG